MPKSWRMPWIVLWIQDNVSSVSNAQWAYWARRGNAKREYLEQVTAAIAYNKELTITSVFNANNDNDKSPVVAANREAAH